MNQNELCVREGATSLGKIWLIVMVILAERSIVDDGWIVVDGLEE